VFNQLKHFRSDKELSVITAFFRAPLADPVVGLWRHHPSILHAAFKFLVRAAEQEAS
jgi:hypothetical protein